DRLREVLLRLNLHERCRQRRLAVVDVTDRADVHVGLVALEFFLGHLLFSTLLVAEPTSGLEPETSSLPRRCSTTELGGRGFRLFSSFSGAGDRIRTGDVQLGRLT